jgi:hypothetical protein
MVLRAAGAGLKDVVITHQIINFARRHLSEICAIALFRCGHYV